MLVTRTARDLLPSKARGSLSWEREQPCTTPSTQQQSTCCLFPTVKQQIPVVHLPSLGSDDWLTLLARCPCVNFPRSRATDYLYLGSKVPKGQARTGPGAPVGCRMGAAARPASRAAAGHPPGVGNCEQAALWWEPGLAVGREMGVCEMKVLGGPVPLLHLRLTPNTQLQFLQTPIVVFRFNKAFFLPSSSSAGDPKNSFVWRWSQKKTLTHQSGIELQSGRQAFRLAGHPHPSWEQNS